MKRCPKCGKLFKEGNFCTVDGTPLETITETPEVLVQYDQQVIKDYPSPNPDPLFPTQI